MVELKLDAQDWEKHSNEHYVSVRVGEVQKLSKLSASRTYKFPSSAVGTRRYGRVELFRRVGSGTVCIDPEAAQGVNDLAIKFDSSELNFKVQINAEKSSQAPPAQEEAKPGAQKVAAAKAYLDMHHLEVRLSEAMQAVLKERPEDPAAYLADRLSKNADIVSKLPKPTPSGAPSPTSAQQAAQVLKNPLQEQPFSSYYKSNFIGMGAKGLDACHKRFPPKVKPPAATAQKQVPVSAVVPFRPYYACNFTVGSPATLAKLYAKFPAKAVTSNASAKPGGTSAPLKDLPFKTYYALNFSLDGRSMAICHARFPAAAKKGPPLPASQSAAAGGGSDASFMKKPSVGTWLVPRRKATPAGAPQVATAPPASQDRSRFAFQPSVGSWLTLAPKKKAIAAPAASPAINVVGSAGAPQFSFKPSVGTWLAGVPELTRAHARLIFSRHGESEWNVANIFTGWVDVDLSKKGLGEARNAGSLLKADGMEVDVAYTSFLKRAIKTCELALESADQMHVPLHKSWRLNERMYGGLTGLDKKETVVKHGAEQVQVWRRSFDVPPPPLEKDSQYHPSKEAKYQALDPKDVPDTECLKDTIARVMPYWEETIVPQLRAGKTVFVAAHGNSIRAILKYIEGISDDVIPGLEIPTGTPLVYNLDRDLRPLPTALAVEPLRYGRYLGDAEAIKAAAEKVKNQTKVG